VHRRQGPARIDQAPRERERVFGGFRPVVADEHSLEHGSTFTQHPEARIGAGYHGKAGKYDGYFTGPASGVIVDRVRVSGCHGATLRSAAARVLRREYATRRRTS
jgi:hypothetical protein